MSRRQDSPLLLVDAPNVPTGSSFTAGELVADPFLVTRASLTDSGGGAVLSVGLSIDQATGGQQFDVYLFQAPLSNDPAQAAEDTFAIEAADVGAYIGKVEVPALAALPGANAVVGELALTEPLAYQSGPDNQLTAAIVCRFASSIAASTTLTLRLRVTRF